MEMISSWWSGGSAVSKEKSHSEDETVPVTKSDEVKSDSVEKENKELENNSENESPTTMINSEAALNAAKDIGNMLFNFAKVGTQKVTETATILQKKVEENVGIVGEFHKEQEKFIKEKSSKRADAAVPPWVGYNEEEQMKEQILALSQDKRNFLRNPPSGVQFHFDFNSSFPIAMATLQEDEDLQKRRFELVPSRITEEQFWRNYFYRVSLIKQSSQLTSLASSTSSSGNNVDANSKPEHKTSPSAPEASNQEKNQQGETSKDSSKQPLPEDDDMATDLTQESPLDDGEFISDAFQSELDQADLKKGMEQLGMNSEETKEEVPEWEKELQKELSDYEVVAGDIGEDEEWEKEINNMLDAEAASDKTT